MIEHVQMDVIREEDNPLEAYTFPAIPARPTTPYGGVERALAPPPSQQRPLRYVP
jgi:hypothetical protein